MPVLSLRVLTASALLVLLLLLHCVFKAGPSATQLPAKWHVAPELDLALLDGSARYAAHTFLVKGSRWSALAGSAAAIATHSSLEHLHWLAHTASSWTGPLSVAVFAPGASFHFAACYIDHLRTCHPSVREKVSFHVVSPVDRPPALLDRACAVQLTECNRDPRTALGEVVRLRDEVASSGQEHAVYPQNLLRNLARRTCPTRHVLTVDVDMVFPSESMSLQLQEFLSRQDNCSRCAFVLPVYEVSNSVGAMPENKTGLISLVTGKLARPYHVQVFNLNQGKSNLARWEKIEQTPSERVAYRVHNYQLFYEPIYVSARTAPLYDERFVGYGNTRNTQTYEMHLAGWTFHVLSNTFLVHWGFQTPSMRNTTWRLQQQEENARRFVGFLREMTARYNKDPLNMLKRVPKKEG
ncbi:beta-1,4-glucuronyltransferase 1-like [Bacillus rossius redtenbacheri]|uniref:beta-1,4-glucuronyltransferase 1-like n=1 Tax=Bacillus rossius redtenbacheri TaxID=93214 RepID=UPI002FDDB546